MPYMQYLSPDPCRESTLPFYTVSPQYGSSVNTYEDIVFHIIQMKLVTSSSRMTAPQQQWTNIFHLSAFFTFFVFPIFFFLSLFSFFFFQLPLFVAEQLQQEMSVQFWFWYFFCLTGPHSFFSSFTKYTQIQKRKAEIVYCFLSMVFSELDFQQNN